MTESNSVIGIVINAGSEPAKHMNLVLTLDQ